MVHNYACPLCSSEKISIYLNSRDYFLSGKPFALFKCSSCSFVFTQDYPEEHEIGKYYESEEYISHNDSSKGFSDRIYRLVRNIMLRRKRRMVQKITSLKKGNILDIGSGSGHFALAMKKAGWQVKGIEINEKARKLSASKLGIEIIDPKDIASLKTSSFDCITLWHVLEHFHEPFEYFREIMRLLKPGGICVTALPNCSSYDARHYREFWAAYDVPRHLWHFTPATFALFSEKTGFRTEKVTNLPIDVFYISYVSEKYKEVNNPFVKGIIRAKFYAIGAFFNKERSSSIIYILRKPAENI
jgi:2-polyprenyl-3-methyl-5-hydroxy-6-metoxy-1,4-benzoquinol methylase